MLLERGPMFAHRPPCHAITQAVTHFGLLATSARMSWKRNYNFTLLGSSLKNQFILLFSLFFLLFMRLIVLFGTIYWSNCTILINFYFYL